MSPRLTLVALGLTLPALLVSTGCVAQREIDQYREQYRLSQEQILDLQNQLADKDRQIEVLRGQKDPNASLQAQLADALADRASLEAALAQARDQLARAGSTPIPIELSDELEALANANPDLMSYDKETGAIRFRSDVTFALGQADVRDSAVPIIDKLAQVLNSPAASEYEVRVVGHTDNVPMRNAMNQQRYGDNWGLSTARAISVMKEFRTAGISESRMSVAGYGEFRPVVENTDRGSEQNRRVEIYLVPMPGPSAPSPTAPNTSATPAAGSETVEPMDNSPAPPAPTEEGPEAFK